jgi:hypothetical protein
VYTTCASGWLNKDGTHATTAESFSTVVTKRFLSDAKHESYKNVAIGL